MSNKTIGPWDWDMDGSVAHIMEQHPDRPDCGYCLATVGAFNQKTTKRYARLIVAAPKLLEACKAVVKWYEDSGATDPAPGSVELWAQCRKALALVDDKNDEDTKHGK